MFCGVRDMRELEEQIQLENSLQTPKSFKQKAAAREGGCKVKGWSKPGIRRGQGDDPEEINKGGMAVCFAWLCYWDAH